MIFSQPTSVLITRGSIEKISLWQKSSYGCQAMRKISYSTTKKNNPSNVPNSDPNRHQTLIKSTRKWFETIVIGSQKLCPFAPPFSRHSSKIKSNSKSHPALMRIVASGATNIEEAALDVASEVHHLFGKKPTHREIANIGTRCYKVEEKENHDGLQHETTLVVFDDTLLPEIRDFQSFVRLSWKMQMEAVEDIGFGKDLQLVLFHPNATHETYAEPEYDSEGNQISSADAASYTIRSPYPTVHLLREQDVMRAVQSGYPNLEILPARNKEKLRKLGLEKCAANLSNCYILD